MVRCFTSGLMRNWAISGQNGQLQGEPDGWKRYWKDPKTKLYHFYTGDNNVFHTIIFPTMLKLQGDYVLPYQEPANEFLNIKGLKFSLSEGVRFG